MKNAIYKYWGKAEGEDKFHLLVYHCLDVASVGKEWINENPSFLEQSARAWGLSENIFKNFFLFFLTLHDIGKFEISFQNLRPDLLKKLKNKENVDAVYGVRHDQWGYIYYEKIIKDRLYQKYFSGLKKKTYFTKYFGLFACVVFGHHGIPPESVHRLSVPNPDGLIDFTDLIWDLFISDQAMNELTELLNNKKQRKQTLKTAKKNTWQLAGLTVLCDWLGSDDERFPYCATRINLSDYFQDACKKAVKAIECSGVLSTQLSSLQGMKQLFPDFADSPTPLQKFCNDVNLDNKPHLWILEDITGSGKTEAALTLASRILEKGGGSGCFVALPTMATSNAMYERMAGVYFRIYKENSKPSLTLIHGSRHLSDMFRESYKDNFQNFAQKGKHSDDQMDEGRAHCSQWLADSAKKALLSDVGVGTVDQLLMGGIPVRHQSLRIFGMASKVLIIDEVHSFDAYMLRLLENLIHAHTAFGGSVILLSATLPQEIRKRFCRAFADASAETQKAKKKAFPLVTSVCAAELMEKAVGTRSLVSREVAVEFFEDIDDVYALVLESASNGKCVCWIRNTIRDVIESFEEFECRNAQNIDIFHSRFILEDRLEIEKRVRNCFGKGSTQNERKGQILIASQVVEQSLDLDFDVIISDLAPIDLLIQRSGRLHRHNRGKRDNPVFYVHIPREADQPTEKWYADSFPAAQWVYQDTALLWRTKEILKQQKRIKLPEAARLLIESVYGGKHTLECPGVFMESEDTAWSKRMADTSIADFNTLAIEKGYCRRSSGTDKWDERVSSRLSDPVNKVYLCSWDGNTLTPHKSDGEFSWDFSSLSVRKQSLKQIDYDNEIQGHLNDLYKKRKFQYDALFLVFNSDDDILTGKNEQGQDIHIHYSKKYGLKIEKA